MWLLENSVRQLLEQAQSSGVLPTVEQQVEYEAQYAASLADSGSRVLSLAGTSAEIAVKGILTKTPSFLAVLFGGGNTTYAEIISAIAEAEQNADIEKIIFSMDSPGGHFDGLFDTLAAIQAAKKPTETRISNVGASAAYAIAAQTDTITVANVATRVGSIGVVATFNVFKNEIAIASTNAPKKRPDVTTEEGKAVVREQLDAMHEIFVDAIAEGRGATVEKINADFGQGATLLAKDALSKGMIDAIAKPVLKAVESTKTSTARNSGDKLETGNMNLTELKAQHPDTFAAAVQQGIDQERDRVMAHLTMGEGSGDTKTAFAAIKDGSAMTATLQAAYMTAGMNRSDLNARNDDNPDDDAGTGGDDVGDPAETVASLVEARLGVNGEG